MGEIKKKRGKFGGKSGGCNVMVVSPKVMMEVPEVKREMVFKDSN